MRKLLFVVLLAVAGGILWSAWQEAESIYGLGQVPESAPLAAARPSAEPPYRAPSLLPTSPSQPAPTPAAAPAQQFTCDGREYCSQMRSRAEAEFFVRNCPNTKMDGDRDGIPCENDSRF